MLLAPLLFVMALAISAASCDGGPPNGELTVRNETERPIMWLSDVSYEAALEGPRFLQRIAVIEPGDSDVVSYGRPPGAANDNWCIDGVDFWVITAVNDNVTHFQRPIDPSKVTIEEHLVGQCWDGQTDEYIVD